MATVISRIRKLKDGISTTIDLTSNYVLKSFGFQISDSAQFGLPLHTNASGGVYGGKVALTTDVSGILPVANGGTGASDLNAFVQTGAVDQTVAGIKTFTGGLLLNCAVTLGSGESMLIQTTPSDAYQAVNKNYVDSLISGIQWVNPSEAFQIVTNASQAGTPPAANLGDTFIANNWGAGFTDGTIYWYDTAVSGVAGTHFVAGNALTSGMRFVVTKTAAAGSFAGKENQIATYASGSYTFVAPADGDAVLIHEGYWANQAFTFETASNSWIQFTGTGQINAGIGLSKTGNTLNINLGAGIVQLPTDEVGLDLYKHGSALGLVNPDTGVVEGSPDTAAVLAVLVDGSTMTIPSSTNVLTVGSISATKVYDFTTAAWAAFTGGDGITLTSGDISVNADRGLTLVSDNVGISLASHSGMNVTSGLAVDSSIAGDALMLTNGVLDIKPNRALTVISDFIGIDLAANSALNVTSGLSVDTSIAGAGLAMASGVMSVGSGAGISVASDSISVNLATNSGLNTTSGLAIDSLAAGAGLTLTSGVFAVGQGNGLVVAADTVSLASSVAGDGLAFSSGVVSVNTDRGITVVSDSVGVNLASNSALNTTSGLAVNVDSTTITITSDTLSVGSIVASQVSNLNSAISGYVNGGTTTSAVVTETSGVITTDVKVDAATITIGSSGLKVGSIVASQVSDFNAAVSSYVDGGTTTTAIVTEASGVITADVKVDAATITIGSSGLEVGSIVASQVSNFDSAVESYISAAATDSITVSETSGQFTAVVNTNGIVTTMVSDHVITMAKLSPVSGTDKQFLQTDGSNLSWATVDLTTVTLQAAYVNGNTITTVASEGDLAITLGSATNFTVAGAGALTVSAVGGLNMTTQSITMNGGSIFTANSATLSEMINIYTGDVTAASGAVGPIAFETGSSTFANVTGGDITFKTGDLAGSGSVSGNIIMTAGASVDGRGQLQVNAGDSVAAAVLLENLDNLMIDMIGGVGEVTISLASASGNYDVVLPAADGSVGQYLHTDGSGHWGWSTVDLGSVTYTAGDGLTLSSANVFDIGQGAGIAVSADAIAISLASNSGLNTTAGLAVDAGIAGNGLDLTAGVLSVKANRAITVVSDYVGIDLGANSGLNTTSGLVIDSSVAGLGLTLTAGVLDVVSGIGLTSASDSIGLTMTNAAAGKTLQATSASSVVWAYPTDDIVGAVAGEDFEANKTFVVRWALNGETAGRVYNATKDQEGHPGKYWAIGVIQTTAAVSAGDAVVVIKSGKLNLKSGDANFNSTDNGLPLFLQAAGLCSTAAPDADIVGPNAYASSVVGFVILFNSTVTNSVFEVNCGPGSLMGIDVANT